MNRLFHVFLLALLALLVCGVFSPVKAADTEVREFYPATTEKVMVYKDGKKEIRVEVRSYYCSGALSLFQDNFYTVLLNGHKVSNSPYFAGFFSAREEGVKFAVDDNLYVATFWCSYDAQLTIQLLKVDDEETTVLTPLYLQKKKKEGG